MTDYIEFSAKIKEKYPQYKDVDDLVLAQKMVEKYPEYKEKVSFEEVEKTTQKENKGIDLTPSGLVKNTLASALAPIRGAIHNEDYKTARENALKAAESFKPAGGAGDFVWDMLGYSQLPVLRGSGALNFVGNAAIQGGVPAAAESLKRGGNALKGAGVGTGIAGALQGLNKPLGKGVQKLLESDAVQKNLPKVLEGLTSAPADYSQRAIEKELAGESILGGKFNAETAYLPIERKLRQAKEMLPTAEDFAGEYNRLGQKAVEGLENLKTGAGQEISEMLGQLGDKPLDTTNIKNAISSTIKSYAKGGNINPAEIRAGKELEQVNNLIGEEAKPIDLHNIKELLYDVANYDTAGGIRNDAIKGVANQINNYLRAIEPKYAKPNDVFSLIKNVEKDAGGLNPSTIGGKISNIGTKGNITSGLDNRLKNIDSLLPNQNKFYKQAQDINAEREAIENIKGMIGQQYERNPRLLANRTDEGFENAINELQKRTGVNFMDELADTRAREALEKFFPGQGGGSGSSQGFGNLLRTALIGGSPTAALITHNPAALAGLALVSPKIMAKGTIKNIGKLSNTAKKAVEGAYDDIINRLSNLGGKAAANMLYGGVEYNDYR